MSGSKTLQVERIGGLGGFGLPGAHLRSRGELDYAALDLGAQRAVDQLFAAKRQLTLRAGSGAVCDGFRYRITRGAGATAETVEAAEADVPAVISACVKDQLV
jgi:hypothetical protein